MIDAGTGSTVRVLQKKNPRDRHIIFWWAFGHADPATAGDVKKMPHHKLRYLAGLAAFVEDMSDDDASDDEPRRRAAACATTTTTRPPPTAAAPTTEASPPLPPDMCATVYLSPYV